MPSAACKVVIATVRNAVARRLATRTQCTRGQTLWVEGQGQECVMGKVCMRLGGRSELQQDAGCML